MPTVKKPVAKKVLGSSLSTKAPAPAPKPSPIVRMADSVNKTRHAVLNTMTQLVTAAFGLVAALAWNDAVQELFKLYLSDGDSLPAKIWYAVLVTLVAVIIGLWLGKLKEK
jgi:hypothetical protein